MKDTTSFLRFTMHFLSWAETFIFFYFKYFLAARMKLEIILVYNIAHIGTYQMTKKH